MDIKDIEFPTTGNIHDRVTVGKHLGRITEFLPKGRQLITLDDVIDINGHPVNQVIMKPVLVYTIQEYI
jgi:hypothetical protein